MSAEKCWMFYPSSAHRWNCFLFSDESNCYLVESGCSLILNNGETLALPITDESSWDAGDDFCIHRREAEWLMHGHTSPGGEKVKNSLNTRSTPRKGKSLSCSVLGLPPLLRYCWLCVCFVSWHLIRFHCLHGKLKATRITTVVSCVASRVLITTAQTFILIRKRPFECV